MTRARVWCVATGIDSPIFDELEQAMQQYPNFTFPAFNKSSLKRVTEDEVSSGDTKAAQWKQSCPDWRNSC